MSTPAENTLPFLRRLLIYQGERFPLARTIPLLLVFSAASVTVSAWLGGRGLPPQWTYLVAFICVFAIFWQMRAMDEVKDFETDRQHRPERPVPRGLISLRSIVGLAVWACLPAILLAFSVTPGLAVFLVVVWLWLALMTKEFFIPDTLHRSPALYLVSHMAIMPLIDLFLTAAEWLPRASAPPAGIWTFLWMSFCNGCVVEFGRKIWAPENERPGVETYSASWGIGHSMAALALALLGSLAGLVACGMYLGYLLSVAIIGILAALAILWIIYRFYQQPSPKLQKRLENAAGSWVLVCYLTPAIMPLVMARS